MLEVNCLCKLNVAFQESMQYRKQAYESRTLLQGAGYHLYHLWNISWNRQRGQPGINLGKPVCQLLLHNRQEKRLFRPEVEENRSLCKIQRLRNFSNCKRLVRVMLE